MKSITGVVATSEKSSRGRSTIHIAVENRWSRYSKV